VRNNEMMVHDVMIEHQAMKMMQKATATATTTATTIL